jgi:Clp amino terminal domain, pathogenicity island component/ClpX C4-type zinc finger
MFQRFSDDARRVVVLAQEDARLLGHDHIGTEHLLLALARLDTGVVRGTFRYFELTHASISARVEELAPSGGITPSGHIPFTPRAKKVLELSLREALANNDTGIDSEHVLLGILTEGTGLASRVLDALDVAPADMRAKVLELHGEVGDRPRAELHVERDHAVARHAAIRAFPGPVARPAPRCSLCGRDEERCERVLISGGVRICSDCIRAAAMQLDALPPDAPRLVRYRRPEVAPSDKDAAIDAIERAFDAVTGPMALAVDDALAFCEGGEACRELLDVIRAVHDHVPVVINDQTVERVRFLAEDDAEVSVGIWLAGNPQPMLQPAHAVREDGTWKVSRSSVSRFADQARPFLPPRF